MCFLGSTSSVFAALPTRAGSCVARAVWLLALQDGGRRESPSKLRRGKVRPACCCCLPASCPARLSPGPSGDSAWQPRLWPASWIGIIAFINTPAVVQTITDFIQPCGHQPAWVGTGRVSHRLFHHASYHCHWLRMVACLCSMTNLKVVT